MRKILFILTSFTIFTIVTSCNKESDKLRNKIKQNTEIFLASEILKDNEYESIDSLKFIKTDTISELHEALMYVSYLTNRSKLNLRLAELNEGNDNISSKISLDSSTYYAQKASDIIRNFAKYDSIRPIYLQTIFYTQIRLKNATVEKDTLKVTTDLSGNIVLAKEVLKGAENKYK
ncbi:hypothetical protein AB670_00071 [Chryseobacterium sp. MOF25P]|uniref:hypothetical protein n=1 Tax=unclassified Chryseobacterium TaxID=2593645 RepID=UPI0008050369|nr:MULTISPECIES: hypothetical protein [unclassified Chryseobacterium]OBW43541.1 hypothetical protein AB670_00071 [Chryseobacterium sp. MOF25P]OBW46685.1 hypothetical protein AB671_01180 [Chryseobacterium sp. BGARF1]